MASSNSLKAGLEEVLRLLLLIWCHQSSFKHPPPSCGDKIGRPHDHSARPYRKAKFSRYPKDGTQGKEPVNILKKKGGKDTSSEFLVPSTSTYRSSSRTKKKKKTKDITLNFLFH
jgi:hypothetical protein